MHKCSILCKLNFNLEIDDDFVTNLIISDDGICQRQKKICESVVNIYSFSASSPTTIDGDLLKSEEICIKDEKIKINISFPVRTPLTVNIYSKGGFTLSQILEKLKKIYKYMYEKEKRTSNYKKYVVHQECQKCKTFSGIHSEIDSLPFSSSQEECVVCQEEDMNLTQLKCNHTFHSSCIKKWSENHNTCPLCRKVFYSCVDCKDTKYVKKIFRSKILPKKYRDNPFIRPDTDGYFGIYLRDFEDLNIKTLIYYKKKKTLICQLF